MDRRTYLKSGVAGFAGLTLAGCTGGGGDGDDGSGGSSGGDGGDGGSDGESTPTESGEGTPDASPDSIVIGSDIPYPPFEYRDENNDLVGFDVDIAEAVFGEQLDIDYEFQATAFDTIIGSLNNGNFRIIMSAMTIKPERAEKVDFSDPYFTAYQTIVVRQGSDVQAKEDLKGADVGVQKGTTGEGAAEKLKEEFGGDLTIESYDQINGAFDALLNNQVSAVINDNTVNAGFVEKMPDKVRFVEGEGAAAEQGKNAPPYLTLTVEEYGIAFRKNDDAFRKKVNDALAAIREDGTYDEIYSEYFSG
jgi:polar amino acid transport system substrate-binding protein